MPVPGTATAAPRTSPAAPDRTPDYWYDRFHAYMPPALRRSYLATPPAERFSLYGEWLLEVERRDAALEPYRDRLSAADLDRYRALPDLESSLRFLDERSRAKRP